MSATTVVGAVIVDSIEVPVRVVAARRTGKLAGHWEFPGGKVEPGETPEAALTREVVEELGAHIEVVKEIAPTGGGWEISEVLILRLFLARVVDGELEPGSSHDAVEWLSAEELDDLDWLPSDRTALDKVRTHLGW